MSRAAPPDGRGALDATSGTGGVAVIIPSPASEVLHLLGQLSDGEVVIGGTAAGTGVPDKPRNEDAYDSVEVLLT